MALHALVFDAYGTIFDPLAVRTECERHWPGRGDELARLWRAKQLEWTWQRSLMQRYLPFSRITRDALAFACEALGLDTNPGRTQALIGAWLTLAPYPDAREGLARLAARGVRLAILSNGSPDMLEPLVAHAGFDRVFWATISVDAVSVFKPDPRTYRLACDRLGLTAAETGFVSSNGWDAAGAKSCGLPAWWVRRTPVPAERLDAAPDGVVDSLTALDPALAGKLR